MTSPSTTGSATAHLDPTASPPSLTRQMAQRLHRIANDDLPDDVRHKASMCLLDYLSAVIGGLEAPWAPSIVSYVGSRGSGGVAHQWGLTRPVAVEDAAFGNGALAHSLIRDDMHLMSASHIGVLVLPAVLALAQRDGYSGDAVVRAIVGGYDAATTLGTSVVLGGGSSHFRPSGVNGAFGAAAAAITAVDLDEDQAVSALSFAANAAAGFNEWPWAGGGEINTHAGNAARGGIAAFDLARAGLTASESILEGRDGMFAAYGAVRGEVLYRQLIDRPFGIGEVRFKPNPGCNLTQTPIAAALVVASDLVDRADDIEEVVITTFAEAKAYPGCDNLGPFERVQTSKMSLQYGVASALVFGRVDEETYRNMADPRLARVISRTRIEINEEYGKALRLGQQPATVTVRLLGGEELSSSLPDVPWLDDDGVRARFRGVASRVLQADAVERIETLVADLWLRDDCSELFELFASADYLGEAAPARG
ncbi:MmgE/PrpD family protein [Subtercola lobariae]|uniref:2-methylcitrate dehydratase n=1 Tax=Subtercola lobariae TaxID=1588641 RepID=A0A917BB38_9MICO|nr:MmgE/PrpD family protein [Subtercola lobariae]GGF33736.1 hypothetical protein GCM10011399_28620 [Subtercola lobariae]